MQEKYNVTGMTCAACQARVQKSVSNLTGVQECNVNLLKNSMVVTYDDSPAVSHRLKQLKSAGLIVSRRDGKEVYYRAADTEPAQNFQKIPNGTLALKHCRAGGTGRTLFEEQFRAVTAGKGCMEAYETFPGIEVSFNVFLASEVKFRHDASDSVLEIYYCRSGRVGWNM